jgi:hypothetical protein
MKDRPIGIASDLYLEGARFESQPEHSVYRGFPLFLYANADIVL